MSEQNRYVELSKYRIETAFEKIKAAELLLDNNMIKDSINRSYYAIFDAMRAVLALDGADYKHHSQVIGNFNKNYIALEIFDKKYSSIIQSAFLVRNSSDYDDFYIVSIDDARKQLSDAKEFADSVMLYLTKRWGNEI